MDGAKDMLRKICFLWSPALGYWGEMLREGGTEEGKKRLLFKEQC